MHGICHNSVFTVFHSLDELPAILYSTCGCLTGYRKSRLKNLNMNYQLSLNIKFDNFKVIEFQSNYETIKT